MLLLASNSISEIKIFDLNINVNFCYNHNRTAHERAHLQSDERYSSLKWPWERVVNVQHSLDTSDMEAQKYSDPELYEKFK